jgi:hypothetical protein
MTTTSSPSIAAPAPPASRRQPAWPHLVRSGWPAALAAFLVVGWMLTRFQVSPVDLLTFTVYVCAGLVLPGFVLWRLLDRGTGRPFIADVVFGTSLAYAVELGVYLLVTGAGQPRLAVLWPLVPVAISLHPRFRHRVWRRTGSSQPVAWSWALAAMTTFVFATFAAKDWVTYPLTAVGLRHPYMDQPYHLALVGALRRDVPAQLPFVDGDPLYYHWFVHADLAAASWATRIEPVVLLQRLGPAPMVVVILLGSAMLAQRLTGSALGGLVAPALLTVLGTASVPPVFGPAFVSSIVYLSPTTTFGNALLVAAVAASLSVMRDTRLRAPGMWLVAVVALLALSGAKGSVLPVVAAGYLGVLVLSAVLARRLHAPAALLLAATVASVLLAQRFVYGGSSQGLYWGPLALADRYASDLGLAPSEATVPTGIAAAVAVLYVLGQLSFAAGIVGLLRGGLWRDARAQFLVGAAAAGAGATLAFENTSLNQLYFIRMTPVLVSVASAWGFTVLVRRLPAPSARPAILVAGAVGAAVSVSAVVVSAVGFGNRDVDLTALQLVTPWCLVLGCLAVAATVVHRAARQRPHWRRATSVVLVGAVLSLGLPYTVQQAVGVVASLRPEPYVPVEATATIGAGGIAAARWLRAHAGADEVVATNEHCRLPHRPRCDARSFWLSGHSERQVLVEGWTYSYRTGARAEQLHQDACCLPFWDPERLADNDAVFTRPTRAGVDLLRTRYGVDWLVLDTRFAARLAPLEGVADLVYRRGEYAVFDVR